MSPIDPTQVAAFVLVALNREGLLETFSSAFRHAWTASYQIGFGPPLVGATPELKARVKEARSAMDKMQIYFDACIFDEEQRIRLSTLFRRRLVQRMGPVEAEAIDAASSTAVDLSLRLHVPFRAPPKAAGEMDRRGVDFHAIDPDTPPDLMTGRFVVRLHDPLGDRLLHIDDVAACVPDGAEAHAVELRVPHALRNLWGCFLEQLAEDANVRFVDLGEPTSHARVLRNGHRQ